MRATLVALCLLAGCSQVLGLEASVLYDAGTDASGDALDVDAGGCGTNDFDLDGLPDNCDLCPHLPSNTQADLDGDGVGDECDPRPAKEDARALWLGFYSPSDIAGWTASNGGAWDVSNQLLHATGITTSYTTLDSPTSYSSDIQVTTSLVIKNPGTPQVGFCAATMLPSTEFYCCVIANGISGKASATAVSQYPGSPGQLAAISDVGPGLTAGESIDIHATVSGSQFECRFVRQTASKVLMTAAGGRSGPVGFFAETAVDYQYVFVVTMAP